MNEAPANILPSSARLLHGIRTALDRIAGQDVDAATRYALAAADAALNELMLREDTDYYIRFYASMRALIAEGVEQIEQGAYSLATELATLPPALDPATGPAALGGEIHRLLRCGEHLVQAAQASGAQAVIDRVVQAERAFHDYGASAAPRPAGAPAATRRMPDRDTLQAYLRHHWPDRPDVSVTEFRRLTGGFQKITILFETDCAKAGRQCYVIRAEKDEEKFIILPAGKIADEFHIATIAYRAGIPMAEPLWLEIDPAPLGRRFMVSRKVEGENFGSAVATSKVLNDTIVQSFVATLAQIHAMPIGDGLRASSLAGWLDHGSMAANTRAAVEAWRVQLFMGTANPSPIMAYVFSWLLANVPDEEAPLRMLHVDYGPHNILVENDRVSAVLDWEGARIGDPAEDLSYFIQCTAAQTEWLKAKTWYEEAAGYTISNYRLRYFDVFNLVKILVGSASASAMYEAIPDAGIDWSFLMFKYMSFAAGMVQDRIAAAEAAKGG